MLRKALKLTVLVLACLFATAATAMAAPRINYVKNTGPIAYDLKSLQTTRFYASVDTANVYAVLKVKTSRGDVTIFKGAIPAANTNYYFPLWNGMGPDGKRMAPASYTWVLTASKGGYTTTATGKILVSNICWGGSGTTNPGVEDDFTGYLKARATNVYVTARTPVSEAYGGAYFGYGYWEPPADSDPNELSQRFSAEHPLNIVHHISMHMTGIYTFGFGSEQDVSYRFTVIQ